MCCGVNSTKNGAIKRLSTGACDDKTNKPKLKRILKELQYGNENQLNKKPRPFGQVSRRERRNGSKSWPSAWMEYVIAKMALLNAAGLNICVLRSTITLTGS